MRGKKGVSVIIGTTLLILIAVGATATLYLLYAPLLVPAVDTNKMLEDIVISKLDGDGTNFAIYILNKGKVDVVINRIYLEDLSQNWEQSWHNATANVSWPIGGQISVNNVSGFLLSLSETINSTKIFKAVTTRGTEASLLYVPTTSVPGETTPEGGSGSNYTQFSITVFKFNDLNINGIHDAGEPLISDWRFIIKDAITGMQVSGQPPFLLTNSGYCTFQNLNKGLYIIEEQPEWRNGTTLWFNSTLSSYPVEINSQNATIWIGNYPVEWRYTLRGYVFNDRYPDYGNGTKGNGIYDTNETGLGNWTVTYKRLTGIPQVGQVKTSSNGYYEFTGLANGIYIITAWQEDPLQVWIPTNSNPNSTTIVDMSPPLMNFSFYQIPISVSNYSTITGLVFNDTPVGGGLPDGIFNTTQGDTGIASMTVLVYQGVGFDTPFSDARTNESGHFNISLIPGIYTIQVSFNDKEWDPTTVTSYVVDLTASNQSRDFGLYYNPLGTQTLYITGIVYNDENGNGMLDGNETGIPNISVYRNNTSIYVATTGDGTFLFDNQPKGDWRIFLDNTTMSLQLPGYIITTYSSADVTLTTSPVGGIEFGVYQVGKISGTVYYDRDEVAGFDPAFDYPIPDVTVLLNGTISTRTDANGNYAFQGLTPGVYEVQQVPLFDWNFNRTIINGSVYDPSRIVVVSTSNDPQTVDYLNYPSTSLSFNITGTLFLDDDRDGENDIASGGDSPFKTRTYVYLRCSNGTLVSTRTDSTLGRYAFTNLAAGQDYTVYINNIAGYTFTTPQSILIPNLVGNQTVDFGIYNTTSTLTYTISGVKYNDTDPYGVYNTGDTRISNWGIYLYTGTNTSAVPYRQNYTYNGNYFFNDVPPGTYTLVELVEPGWTNMTVSIVTFDLTDHVVQDFFNNYTAFSNTTQLYSIGGRIFNDIDNSGTYTTGDTAISNQLVILYDNVGYPIDFAPSNSSGLYVFASLASGNYSLMAQTPSGYTPTTPTSQVITNLSSNLTIDFGFRSPTAPITYAVDGFVWRDINKNGQFDKTESGISGWTVYLYAGGYSPYFGQYFPGPTPTATTTTNGSGYYRFTGLGNTTYAVVSRLTTGYENTTPRQVTFTIAGASFFNASFGNVEKTISSTRYISGFKFNDTDNSRDYTAGETKLSNWTIWLVDDFGYPIRSVTSNTLFNNERYFNFTSLPNGNYTMYEQLSNQAWWTNSTPGVVNVLISGSSSSSTTFGNRLTTAPETYLISGLVYNDTNKNDLFDDGNAIMTDSWMIFLYSGGYSPFTFPTRITTTTGGQYSFSGLSSGTYTVVEVLKNGYTNVWPRAITVTISGASMTNQSFFNQWVGPQPTHLVYGYKFNDTDLNQQWNQTIPDEAALSGWVISIYDSFGFPVASATTSSTGYYSFLVPDGTYTVSEDLSSKAGWTNSTPYRTDITVAGTPVRADFGNYYMGLAPRYSVYGWVFNDTNQNSVQDVGEAGLSGWTVTLRTTAGASLATTTTNGSGFYIFANRAPGNYRVDSTRASTAYVNTTEYRAFVDASLGDTMQNFGWYYNYTPVILPTISGRVYNTANTPANGLANWAVIVSNGTYVNSKLTDSTGNYSFTLYDGGYAVQAIVMGGYYNITPSTVAVTLSGGNLMVDFGMSPSADLPRYTVSGLKYNDLDMDGVQDAGELPIASWGFVLYNSTDIFNAFTNDSGIFEFSGLLAGTYTVNETYRGGWAASTPASVTIDLSSNGTFLAFGNYLNYSAGLNFSISGYALTNGTGTPLSGWLLTLADYQGVMVDSQLTSASGFYNFSSLAGGKYTVTSWYDSGAGWKNVTSSVVAVEITTSSIANLNFYYIYDRYNITGYVFFDTDKNGVYVNTTDLPLAGWQVLLRNQLGDTIATTTDSNGRYEFAARPPGTYTVSEVTPLGWNATTSSSVPITVTNSGISVNFGNKRWFYGQFLTYDRSMWSADINGYLNDTNIPLVYGSSWVISIGSTSANINQWDNSSFIKGYLVNSNPPAVLAADYWNPSGALPGHGGTLGANLLALKFNIDYDRADFGLFDFGPSETLLEDLRVFNYSAAANGKTIGQIFTEANAFIGTGVGSMSAAEYNTLIARINSAFSGTDYTDATFFLY
jgi:hypothetical protein